MSDKLGIPQSSMSVLAKSLVELGYLERNDKNRTFYPTLRVALLGTWMRRTHKRAGQLPRLLSEVTRKTGHGTTLAMKNGIYSQFLITQPGRDPTYANIESGMLYPLACCSTGWCLLTLENSNSLDKIVRRTISETDNEYWRQTAKDAAKNVAETQRRGYAITNGSTMEGASGIAILLPSLSGAYAMSVAVGGRTENIFKKSDQILEALEELRAAVRSGFEH